MKKILFFLGFMLLLVSGFLNLVQYDDYKWQKNKIKELKSDAQENLKRLDVCIDRWDEDYQQQQTRIARLQQKVVKIRNDMQMQLNECVLGRLPKEKK
ncbi:MAG: hypothetical protein AABY22_03420 [Nanoarchaeota archaeon]